MSSNFFHFSREVCKLQPCLIRISEEFLALFWLTSNRCCTSIPGVRLFCSTLYVIATFGISTRLSSTEYASRKKVDSRSSNSDGAQLSKTQDKHISLASFSILARPVATKYPSALQISSFTWCNSCRRRFKLFSVPDDSQDFPIKFEVFQTRQMKSQIARVSSSAKNSTSAILLVWGCCTGCEIQHILAPAVPIDLHVRKRLPPLKPKPEVHFRLYCRHLEKSIWRQNAAGGVYISINFGRHMQNRIKTANINVKKSYFQTPITLANSLNYKMTLLCSTVTWRCLLIMSTLKGVLNC